MTTWDEVRAIDWSRLEGAFGTGRDVPAALETLRFGRAIDDDFEGAWRNVLYAHAWHRGSIFPVTSAVLPFVFDIVDQSPALGDDEVARSEIAMFVALAAAAARRADPETGTPVIEALVENAHRLRAWTRSELRYEALVAMLTVPELARGVLAGEVAGRVDVLVAILSHATLVDAMALAWATRELVAVQHPVTDRARTLLRSGPLGLADADWLALVAAALASDDARKQLDALRGD